MPAKAIYALVDPDTHEIRYIGQTAYPKRRFSYHTRLSCNQGSTHRQTWLRSLIGAGKQPVMVILEETDTSDQREMYWIDQGRKAGLRLTNTADGGVSMGHLTRAKSKSRYAGRHTPIQTVLMKLKRANHHRYDEVLAAITRAKRRGGKQAINTINRQLECRLPFLKGGIS